MHLKYAFLLSQGLLRECMRQQSPLANMGLAVSGKDILKGKSQLKEFLKRFQPRGYSLRSAISSFRRFDSAGYHKETPTYSVPQ
jgi:hypothetical protein